MFLLRGCVTCFLLILSPCEILSIGSLLSSSSVLGLLVVTMSLWGSSFFFICPASAGCYHELVGVFFLLHLSCDIGCYNLGMTLWDYVCYYVMEVPSFEKFKCKWN